MTGPASARALSSILIGLVLSLSISASAQNLRYTENSIDQTMRSSLNVDPSTLGMSFSINLTAYPGRGVNLPVTMNYSSKVWRLKYSESVQGQLGIYTQTRPKFAEKSVAGWTTTLDEPYIEYTPQAYDDQGRPQCTDCEAYQYAYWIERVIVHLPGGETHELRRSNDVAVFRWNYEGAPPLAGIYVATDGSRLKFDADNHVIYLPDGSRYTLPVGGFPQYFDRNGNKLTYNSYDKKWDDTLGRTAALVLNNSSVQTQNVNMTGVGGGTLSFQLVWKNLSQVLTAGGSTQYSGNLICQSPYNAVSPSLFTSPSSQERVCAEASSPTQGIPFNPIVLNEVILPNGRKYIFTYNVYGEIDKVVLPTGGYQRYVYGQLAPIDSDQEGTLYGQTNRGVTGQYISATGLSQDEKLWQYSVSTPSNKYIVSATAPNGVRAEQELYKSYSASTFFGFDLATAGRAYEERTYTSGNQMWRRTLTDWTYTTNSFSSPPPGFGSTRDPRPIKQVGIILDTSGNALAATTTMSYDADLNRTQVNKYAYASITQTTGQTGAIGSIPQGTLQRTDETVYLLSDSDFSGSWTAYRNRHLLGLPTKQFVKNGSGAIVAATKLFYDERALSTYGVTVTGWSDPATTVRGNLTTTQAWLNFNGTSFQTYPSGSFLTTKADYDQCGSVRKTTDANNKETLIFYDDTFSDGQVRNVFAYPTRTETPAPDPSGAFGLNTALKTYTTYDYQTGKVTKTKDANDKETFTYYLSPSQMNRIDKVTLPDGGEVSYVYNDDPGAGNPGNIYIQQKTKQDAITVIEDFVYFDKIGRPWRSAHKESATQWSARDTKYDDLGRIWQVSNPYFTSNLSDPPTTQSIWTTTSYDALSRVLTVTTPDGAVVSTSYSGNQVTVTDQAAKKRSSTTDALGRLTQVNEDPLGLNYQTDYLYDTPGNLAKVTQGGQSRYFLYDSLSRLIRAKNPEQNANSNIALSDPLTGNSQWATKYVYDANSNLTSRTDARNVTASYAYDAINRNITVGYSDSTPGVERHWDGATNGKGRFWYDYAGGNYTQGTKVEHHAIDSYDAIGRPLQQRQYFKTGGVWSGSYQTTRGYDLAGHLTSQTYPSGRSASYTYNSAGRTASYGGNIGDGASRTYADTISYAATGQMTKARFGTVTPLYLNLHYNKRLQLADLRLGDSSSDEWNWSRGALIFYYSSTARDQWNAFADGTDNNGNVLRQVNYVPLSAGGYVIPQLDDYTYDALNRITTISESQQSSGGTWSYGVTSQGYTYDRWGNRTSMSGFGSQGFDATEAAATNRLKLTSGNSCSGTKQGFCYDSAGNLTFDNQTGSGDRGYDAENRMTWAVGGGNNYYTYNADGKRTRRLIGAQEWWQIYGFDGELIAEYAANTAATSPSKEYGYRDGDLLIVGEGAAVKWMVKDHLGTPRMIADQTGSLSGIKRHDYYPFGEENLAGTSIRTTGNGYVIADGVRQKFTGYERDSETGMDYAQARYYANVQGRFTSVDPGSAGAEPGSPQSWNGYAHALNNPVVNIDPDGLKVRICGLDGACTDADTDISDKDFNRYFRDAKDIKLKGGNVYQNGEKIGTFERQSFDDLSPQANAFIFGRGGMIDQSQRAKPVVEALGAAAILQIATPLIGLTNAAFIGIDLAENGGKPGSGTAVVLASIILPPLKFLHSESTFASGSAKGSLEFWRKKGTQEIIESLKPGRAEALKVKPDGTIMNGNTRIKVLQERGVDVNSLPRQSYP